MSCNAIIGQEPGAWGFVPVECRQQVGVRVYVATTGQRVGYCSIPGHEYNVRRRFEEGEPTWFHEEVAHQEHESFVSECPLCEQEMADSAAIAGRPGQTYSRAELTEIAADRELVRDEHLDGMTYARWFAEVYDHADPH